MFKVSRALVNSKNDLTTSVDCFNSSRRSHRRDGSTGWARSDIPVRRKSTWDRAGEV